MPPLTVRTTPLASTSSITLIRLAPPSLIIKILLSQKSVNRNNMRTNMNDTNYIGAASLLQWSTVTWEVAGTTDLDQSGSTDIIWRNSGVPPRVWYMIGTDTNSFTNITGRISSTEKIVAVGDFGSAASSPDDYGNTPALATSISLGTSVDGRINSGGDVDCFSVTITASGVITAESFGATDTYGEWLESGGTVLTYNDDIPDPNYSMNFSLTSRVSPGTYYLRVRHHLAAAGTGAYSVRVDYTPAAAAPTISPNGGTFTGSTNVGLSTTNSGATIYYTTNGADPTTSSSQYSVPFTLSTNATVKALAVKSGMADSDISSAAFTIKVVAPTISPSAGTFINSTNVTLATTTPLAAIYYTTNGADPTTNSSLYGGAFTLSASGTVKARAVKSGMADSAISSETFTIKAAAPTISPNGGAFINSTNVTLATTTPLATIRYTTDGSDPTASSPQYTSVINVAQTGTTIKARAFASGMTNSDATTSAVFTISAAVPTISPSAGTFINSTNVTLATTTPLAAIYYTTNGADPTTNSSLYGGAFTLSASGTVKARAVKSGMTDSAISSETFTIKAAAPTISPNGGTFTNSASVTLATTTPLATIRYTSDGSDPTASSPQYTNVINVAQTGTTIKARAFASGMTNSDATTSAAFTITLATPVLNANFSGDHSTATVAAAAQLGTVYYTTDDTIPTTASASTPRVIGPGITVKARAIQSGYTSSDVATLSPPAVTGSVVFSPNGHDPITYSIGPLSVQMTAEAGATVWYKAGTTGSWLSTTSGSTPSIDGIDSGGSGTIQAYAFSASKFQSGTNVSDSANPYKLRLANPTSTAAYATNSYASGTLAFSAQVGAVIRYTTDGTVPTAATPTVYAALLTYSVPTKVCAKAFKTGYIPSGHISSWVNKLPAPKIAGSAGVIAADTTVENALDVWLLPNFGYPNMYAEERNTSGWNGTVSYWADVPNTDYPGSFLAAPASYTTLVGSTPAINISYGRTYSQAGWFRNINASLLSADYAGICNYDKNGGLIRAEDVNAHEYSPPPRCTYLTQPLTNGATTAFLADETVFVPVATNWYYNFFTPLLNFSSSAEIAGGNQPNAINELMQFVDMNQAVWPQVTNVNAGAKSVTFSPAYSGPTLPVGTAVTRRCAGSAYQYSLFAGRLTPTNWTRSTSTYSFMRAGTEKAAVHALLSWGSGTSAAAGIEFWEGAQADRPNLYYTLDGSAAVYNQAPVSGPVKITLTGNNPGTSSRIINIGQRGSYYIDATPAQRTFTFKVGAPKVASRLEGNNVILSVTNTTAGDQVCYTTDGSEPTTASTAYTEGAEITLAATITTKWKAFKSNYVDSDTVTKWGVPTFSPPSGAYASGQAVTVTSTSAQLKVFQPNPNLLNPSVWQVGVTGSQTGFSHCGQVTENTVEMRQTPHGTSDKVWVAYNDAANDADGGWNSGSFPIDHTKLYRFSVWLRRVDSTPAGTSGSTYSYLGCGGGNVSTLTGTATDSVNNNPYFWVGLLPANEWHLVVGYVRPAGDLTTTCSAAAYNSQGQFVSASYGAWDFRWLASATDSMHRAYLFYCTEVGVQQEFWNPRVEAVSAVTDPLDILFVTPESSPKTITLTGTGTKTIQALSHSSGTTMASSDVATALYTVKVSAPSITPNGGTFTDLVNVTLSTSTTGATICCTTNGTEPTSGSTPYTAPFAMNQSGVVKAKAFKSGMPDSDTTTSAPFTVNTNTPPTISGVQDVSINWNNSVGVGYTVGDAETPNNLIVTATSSNTDLLPDTRITVTGTGASRTISLEPGPDQFGSTTVTVTVTDPGGLTATDQFILTVNSAPTISGIDDQTVISGLAVGPVSFTVKDWETPAGDLTFSASSSNTGLVPNANILLGGTGGERTITVVPVSPQTGTATITILVTDGGGITATESFAVVVSASGGCPAAAGPQIGFDNDHVTSTSVQLTVSTSGGVPAEMAVLVNSEDFDNATWTTFNPVRTVSLGTTDGTYMVWVGVRCSTTDGGRWTGTELVLDRVAPQILDVSPANNSELSTPNLTLTGHSGEELASVTFDVTTPAGETVIQGAVMEPKELNETTFVYGRTDFESVGIYLEEGVNHVVVHVTDLAGNQQSMELQYTLSYANDHTPPEPTVTFPLNGQLISGADFAIQGTVDDNSASVRAVIIGGGETHEVFGSVSRSGHFQIAKVPILSGTNALSVYATDHAGNRTQLQLTVQSSTVQLVMNPIDFAPHTGLVTVTGTVSDGIQLVSVNGVAATVTGAAWTATVAIPGNGGLVFVAIATPSEGGPVGVSRSFVEPPRAFLGHYTLSQTWWTDAPNREVLGVDLSLSWDGEPESLGTGHGTATKEVRYRGGAVDRWVTIWPLHQIQGELWQYRNGELRYYSDSVDRPNFGPDPEWRIGSEQCKVNRKWKAEGGRFGWTRTVTSSVKVHTGSRSQDREEWYLTMAGAGVNWDPWYQTQEADNSMRWRPSVGGVLDNRNLTIGGNKVYRCDGILFKKRPSNQIVDATPRLKGSAWYEIDVTPAWPPVYAMTRAYHPACSGAGVRLQDTFDRAAQLLGIDDDACRCLGTDYKDDVPYYADFYIINDSNPTVFPQRMLGAAYNRVTDATKDDVLYWDGANIKQVQSYPVPQGQGYPSGSIVNGCAQQASLDEPNIVFAWAGRVSASVMAHEWGHTRNLEPARDPSCPANNNTHICDSARANAIMYWQGGALRNEINQTEADYLRGNQSNRPPEP